ncbi:hypothetical protein [Aeoliella sp. SH292]|uniref:hypothetical protein n=1 Tax=Aeoliella sp. SH292 TaxID=3454464 RepID=UPI003F9C3612
MQELTLDQLTFLFGSGLRPRIGRACIMEVEWVGQLQIPNAGEYVFDITPLEMSTSAGDAHDSQEMKVFVNGTQVVSAEPTKWAASRQAITLPAGQVAEVRVTLRNTAALGSLRMGVGQLYWKGPGFARQIVPEALWTVPREATPGVRCTVRWVETDATEHTEVTTVKNIDQILARETPNLVGEPYDQVKQRIYEKLIEDAAFLPPPPPVETQAVGVEATASTEPPRSPAKIRHLHPLGLEHYRNQDCLLALSTPQRMALANKLLEHPESYRHARLKTIMRLHDRLQPGAESAALDILGSWMQMNGGRKAEFATNVQDFYDGNRALFRRACISILWQHPKSFQWLQSDYLVREDGECVLPVAYLLAFGYLERGRILEWIEFLEAKLADETVSGDTRVNWLIARAMAEEIRESPAERHLKEPGRPSAGIQWLEEASLVTKDPRMQARVARERAARLTVTRRWEQADSLMQPHLNVWPKWPRELASMQRRALREMDSARKAETRKQRAEVATRLEDALKRGDDTQAASLQQTLDAMDGKPAVAE